MPLPIYRMFLWRSYNSDDGRKARVPGTVRARIPKQHKADRQEHADAVFPPDSHHAGESVHRAGGARGAGRRRLRHLQRRCGRGGVVQLFVRRNGDGEPAVFQLRTGQGKGLFNITRFGTLLGAFLKRIV